ncbi:hypothetical protein [Gryllotalpicola sp.]|uniref:hypothetical protein n=1 Tax=Gryllotalpicola sp. TaxID=1932787 RepID=UPI00262AF834|nr:hypothetical protein [Gryllotalpicola sp.]
MVTEPAYRAVPKTLVVVAVTAPSKKGGYRGSVTVTAGNAQTAVAVTGTSA